MTQRTLTNLLKTISNQQARSRLNVADSKIRDILLAYRPDLIAISPDTSVEHLLIRILNDTNHKRETIYTYNYNSNTVPAIVDGSHAHPQDHAQPQPQPQSRPPCLVDTYTLRLLTKLESEWSIEVACSIFSHLYTKFEDDDDGGAAAARIRTTYQTYMKNHLKSQHKSNADFYHQIQEVWGWKDNTGADYVVFNRRLREFCMHWFHDPPDSMRAWEDAMNTSVAEAHSSEHLTQDLNSVQKELTRVQRECTKYKAAMENMRTVYQRDIDSQKDQVRIAESEVAKLTYDKTSLEEHANILMIQRDNLTSTCNSLSDLRDKLTTQRDILNEEVIAEKARYAELQHQLNQLSFGSDQLERVMLERDQLKDRCDDMEKELARLTSTAEQHDRDTRSHQELVTRRQKELDVLQQNINLAHARLMDSEQHAELLQSQLTQAHQARDETLRQLQRLESERLQDEEEQKRIVQESVDAHNTIKQLKRELEVSRLEVNSTNAQIQERDSKLRQELEDLQTAWDQREKELAAAKNDARECDEHYDQASQELKQKDGELNQLRLQLDQLRKERSADSTTITELNQQLKELDRELRHANAELDATIRMPPPSNPNYSSDSSNSTVDLNSKKRKSTTATVSEALKKRKSGAGRTFTFKKRKDIDFIIDLEKIETADTLSKLSRIVSEIKVQNKKHKQWPVYDKFLNSSQKPADLELNPEYHQLDEAFKRLLYKRYTLQQTNAKNETTNQSVK